MSKDFEPKFCGLFLRRKKDGKLLSQRRDEHDFVVIDGRDWTTSREQAVLFSGPDAVRDWVLRASYAEPYEVIDGVQGDVAFIACELCNGLTRMLATKRCDACWELEGRIRRDPKLARQILEAM